MVETVYRIIRREDDSFAVEVKRFGALAEMAAGFDTEAAVRSWIEQDKRLTNGANPAPTAASRKRFGG